MVNPLSCQRYVAAGSPVTLPAVTPPLVPATWRYPALTLTVVASVASRCALVDCRRSGLPAILRVTFVGIPLYLAGHRT
ncbi:hypothetical protein [Roseimaritima multifibrata]|uniref:hypothetical protein n=1 Tax=Roseimaritima multifibrata TaxID=1930274 RepID=UPI0011AA4F03|nr:hypothetical protein [Roseimaritima multifibrata]